MKSNFHLNYNRSGFAPINTPRNLSLECAHAHLGACVSSLLFFSLIIIIHASCFTCRRYKIILLAATFDPSRRLHLLATVVFANFSDFRLFIQPVVDMFSFHPLLMHTFAVVVRSHTKLPRIINKMSMSLSVAAANIRWNISIIFFLIHKMHNGWCVASKDWSLRHRISLWRKLKSIHNLSESITLSSVNFHAAKLILSDKWMRSKVRKK